MILFTHSVIGFWCNGIGRFTDLDEACYWISTHFTSDVGFSIFCFLFGLSFFLQLDHAEQKGIDFRKRFCWRLILLFGFAMLDRLCYRGDILALFAVMGILPVLFYKVQTRYVAGIAAFLLIQPQLLMEWGFHLPSSGILKYPAIPDPTTSGWGQIALWNESTGFFCSFVAYALSGRFYAVAGYFLLGMLAGRCRLFEDGTAKVVRLILPLAFLWGATATLEHYVPSCLAFHWWRCEAQMLCMVCSLAWFYEQKWLAGYLLPLRSLGRCTLTGYISQNAIMCMLLYAWGFGLGASLSLAGRVALGGGILMLQFIVFTIWLKHFKFGPLEGIWRRLTRIGLK